MLLSLTLVLGARQTRDRRFLNASLQFWTYLKKIKFSRVCPKLPNSSEGAFWERGIDWLCGFLRFFAATRAPSLAQGARSTFCSFSTPSTPTAWKEWTSFRRVNARLSKSISPVCAPAVTLPHPGLIHYNRQEFWLDFQFLIVFKKWMKIG